MDERVTTTSDSVTHISVPYDPQRFIDNNGIHPVVVKVRLKFKQYGVWLSPAVQVHIDQVQWALLP